MDDDLALHTGPRPPHTGEQVCTYFHRAVELIGRRWMGAILFMLLRGPRRFNELLAAIPNISDRLLAERLRELEAAALLTRQVDAGPPIKVTYTLTPAGRDLQTTLQAVTDWAHRWLPPDDAAPPD